MYSPPLPIVPLFGLKLQVTAVLPDPVTVAVNCCVCEAVSDAAAGVRATVTPALNVTVAEALLVVSATLVAVTVTVCRLAIVDGAVYSPPLPIVPLFGLKLHVTAVLPDHA